MSPKYVLIMMRTKTMMVRRIWVLLITAWSISYMYDNEDEFMHYIIPFSFSLLHQKLLFMHNIQCSITVYYRKGKNKTYCSIQSTQLSKLMSGCFERNTHSNISFLTNNKKGHCTCLSPYLSRPVLVKEHLLNLQVHL